jgi:predicted dehydrogenase
MTKRLKIGVVGCASFAERSAIPAILDCAELFELAGVASRSAAKAQQYAEKFQCAAFDSYDALLQQQDIDLVYLPLPTGLHDQWVAKCLDAGKHVLVEKSMAADFSSAEKMITTAEAKQLLLAENFMFQYHRQMQLVVDHLADGVIGELRQLRSSFGFPPLPPDNFRFDASLGGGALLDAGAYTLKAAQFFLGSSLTVKSASLKDTMGSGVDTLGAAHLENPDGVSALVGFGFDNFYQCNIELWGSEGKLTMTRAFTAKPGFSPEIILEKQRETESIAVESDYPFKNLLEKVHHQISTDNHASLRQEARDQAKLISLVSEAANE